MFTDWNFHHVGAFCKFDKDEYSVPAEEGLKLQTLKYDTRSVTDGGTESFVKIGTLNLAVYNEDWTSASAKAKLTGSDGAYTVTFTEPGTYYLLATDPECRHRQRLLCARDGESHRYGEARVYPGRRQRRRRD